MFVDFSIAPLATSRTIQSDPSGFACCYESCVSASLCLLGALRKLMDALRKKSDLILDTLKPAQKELKVIFHDRDAHAGHFDTRSVFQYGWRRQVSQRSPVRRLAYRGVVFPNACERFQRTEAPGRVFSVGECRARRRRIDGRVPKAVTMYGLKLAWRLHDVAPGAF